MTRPRMAVVLMLATAVAACEFATTAPAPSLADIASPSRGDPPSAAATGSPPGELPRAVAMWCRENVHDVYAVTEGLGIPSDPRPFRLAPDDELRWRPVEGSRNYQVGCAAAYEERASAAPS